MIVVSYLSIVVGELQRLIEEAAENGSVDSRTGEIASRAHEHGAVAGIVTLEDLIEELVGELFSEDESPEELMRLIRVEPDGSAVVRGDVPLREVNRALDTRLDVEIATTIGGLCMAISGGIPIKGTRLQARDGTGLEVIEASPRLVRCVRVSPRRKPDQVDG